MNITKKPSLIAICAAVLIFNFSSCKYEDGPSISLRTKKGRLTGEWEVKYIDNQKVGGSGESLILEFEKDGDVTWTYSYSGSTSSTYKGEWEWEDGKEKIELTVDSYKTEWEITRLTNKEFEFEDEDNDKWELEKI